MVTPFSAPESVGGVQVHVAGLMRAFRDRGHDVALATRTTDEAVAEGEGVEREWEGFDVHAMAYRFGDCDRFERIWSSPMWEAWFGDLLGRVRPDLVHFHHLTCLSTGLPEVARSRGAATVMTLHDYWMGCPRGQRLRADLDPCEAPSPQRCAPCLAQMWPFFPREVGQGEAEVMRWLEAAGRVLRGMDALVTPSAHMASSFTGIGVGAERFHVVPVGIDPAPFKGLLHRSGPRIRIGVMGSVIPSKGIHVLLDAARQLDPVRTEIRIHGEATPWHQDQDYGDRLRAQVEPDGPLVRFLGRFPEDGAADVLAGLDVLVVPSIWPEAFGMTIREAWLAGVPVVASRTGALAEGIEDGVDGLLFTPGDADDLARCLQRLTDDARLRYRLARAPKQVAAPDETADALESVYAAAAAHTPR